MRQTIRRWVVLLVIIMAVIAVDQITKKWIIANLFLGETVQPIPALSSVFQLTYIYNTGSAFGILPQASDFFLVIAVVVVTAMLYFFPRVPEHAWLTRFATALVVGGALGNALDRLQYGLVVDFIHYQIPGIISNVSNLADHAIVGGVILLFIDSWRNERREKRERQNAETPDAANITMPESETAEN
jgi:signal peptidase II